MYMNTGVYMYIYIVYRICTSFCKELYIYCYIVIDNNNRMNNNNKNFFFLVAAPSFFNPKK